jgi:hypothetical protein
MSEPEPIPLLVRRWRLLPGHRLPRGSAPLGVAATEPFGELRDGDAVWFQPGGLDREAPEALAGSLPDAASIGLIVVSPLATEGGFLSRVLGRELRVPRAVRGSALLLRGYRRIGGGVDPASGLDLCWGRSA